MTDLFNDNNPKEFLPELVGDGKKFKTVEELAKGKYEADLYINDLIRQKDELRADYLKLRDDSEARGTLKDMLDKLRTNEHQRSSEEPKAKESEKPAIDPSTLEDFFDKKFREREVSRTKEQNTKLVVDALKERFGHSYVEVLNKQTEELGLTKEAVNYLAETTPKALLKTLGLDEAPKTDPFQAPPRNTSFASPKGQQKRTWSYYMQLKKDNPKVYLDPKTQVQMHKDYQAYGKEFEDGDFLTLGQGSAF